MKQSIKTETTRVVCVLVSIYTQSCCAYRQVVNAVTGPGAKNTPTPELQSLVFLSREQYKRLSSTVKVYE